MPAWLARLGATVWAWVVAIVAAIGVIFGFYHMAKRQGKTEAERDEAKRETETQAEAFEVEREKVETRIETVKVANDVTAKVNSADSGVAADKLRDEWSRD